jgi:hypothetical protein
MSERWSWLWARTDWSVLVPDRNPKPVRISSSERAVGARWQGTFWSLCVPLIEEPAVPCAWASPRSVDTPPYGGAMAEAAGSRRAHVPDRLWRPTAGEHQGRPAGESLLDGSRGPAGPETRERSAYDPSPRAVLRSGEGCVPDSQISRLRSNCARAVIEGRQCTPEGLPRSRGPAVRSQSFRLSHSLIHSLIRPRSRASAETHREHTSQAADSPGLARTPGRTLGKRVGGNPSRVRISHPPPPLTRQYTSPGHPFGPGLQGCAVSFVVSFILRISV